MTLMIFYINDSSVYKTCPQRHAPWLLTDICWSTIKSPRSQPH